MSRYVNLDEILELFGTCSDEDMDARLNIQDAISEKIIELVEFPKWIPCEERLPSDGEWCLVSVNAIDDIPYEIVISDKVSYCYERGWATAWMPLPEPWKGADDETD